METSPAKCTAAGAEAKDGETFLNQETAEEEASLERRTLTEGSPQDSADRIISSQECKVQTQTHIVDSDDWRADRLNLDAVTGSASSEPQSKLKSKSKSRRPPQAPSRIYNPPSLMQCCLATIGEKPREAVLQQNLYGLGESLLAQMIYAIYQQGNLTIPLVRHFESVAKEEGHDLILRFVEGLDIFAAI